MIRPSLLVLSSGRGLIDLLVRLDEHRLPRFHTPHKADRRDLRLARVYDPVAAVAFGDGETHCSKVRLDEVPDGARCGAKQ